MINGFRNRDVREALHGKEAASVKEQRRQSAAVTRKLRLLQAHELIRKEAGSHRYQLTEHGQRTITAVLAVRRTDVAKLMKDAA
jgi:DNA-binding HxlR family transcriptional regulator